MDTIFSEKHKLRDSQTELYGGQLVYPHERHSWMGYILKRLTETGFGRIHAPDDFGINPIRAIHDGDFIQLLENAWNDWENEGFEGEAIASNWAAKRMSKKCPNHIGGKLGYYALAAETSFSRGTWEASYASAQVGLTAAEQVHNGKRSAVALCHTPCHHATADMYGGYCFLNNAAIAAQHLRDKGAARVAILDVEFYHGNGAQDIFYNRDYVLFVSLHGDPMDAFPYYLEHAAETGTGTGQGYTLNFPMPPKTGFEDWRKALLQGLGKIADFTPDTLLISFGVDTFENDPISFFKLKSDDYLKLGADIAAAGLPTIFVMEGGYDIEEIGVNTVHTLIGFENAV